MNTIVAILRATHCKSVHHYFAIDALCEVTTQPGMQLVNMLLAQYGNYLKGAKAPDTLFKDFENHVVHVQDGYWGGAAKTANKWLAVVNQKLKDGQWKEAAYAIGVLSHYFTDPFMPLHTAQSPREAAIHRPLEWSVCCAYNELYRSACNMPELIEFELPKGDHWLTDAIHTGARLGNQYYDLLLDDYDITESRRYPIQALGVKSKYALSQIFAWVITAWSSALDRIASDANVIIPNMSLAIPTLLASSQTPLKKMAQTMANSEQLREIELMLEEYLATGKVVKNVPLEQRDVRRLREQIPNLRPSQLEITRAQSQTLPKLKSSQTPSETRIQPIADTRQILPAVPELVSGYQSQQYAIAETVKSTPSEPLEVVASDDDEERPVGPRPKRPALNPQSPIVDAPAIGPMTAARMQSIGCHTVEDLLTRDAAEIADALHTSWIKPEIVEKWQIQAELACCIERLTAVGAGLLVMIGIHSASELAECDVNEIHAAMADAAKTPEGIRLLRQKGAPPVSVVRRWIDSAQSACQV
jgi:hypothetical protein